jgi:sacsin
MSPPTIGVIIISESRKRHLLYLVRMNMAESSGGIGESFGQKRPPLYEMIKNILREYPSGQLFKVMARTSTEK